MFLLSKDLLFYMYIIAEYDVISMSEMIGSNYKFEGEW